MKTTQAELVFVPTPGMGHLLSTVEAAKLILQRDQRISVIIFIINFPKTSFMLSTFVEDQIRDNPYPSRLTFVNLPPLANPPDHTSKDFFSTFISLHKPLVKQVIEDRVKAGLSSGPAGFVLDMFCTVMIDVAVDFKVPSYIFFTSGANFLNLIFHFQSLEDDHGIDITTEFSNPDTEFDVPGFKNRLAGKNIPSVFLDREIGASMILNLTRSCKKSNGIIVNTFTELESLGVQALLDQVAKGNIPKLYPVGPILQLDRKSAGGSSQKETEESIIQWLDDQPSSSVVYICFGSMGSLEADQVKEIANGLEKSGHRFLWSLRKPPAEGKVGIPGFETYEEALPEGFLDRTAERGKIYGWTPQIAILGHPAVGGFVSHCGWNSTLESLWFGVPMATWPLYAEQQLNAFELVKELGLAVEIRMDYRRDRDGKSNFTVTAEEIENGVKNLMSMDEVTKNRVREMKDQSKKALGDGGSSHKWLGRFIEDVFSNVA